MSSNKVRIDGSNISNNYLKLPDLGRLGRYLTCKKVNISSSKGTKIKSS